MNMSRFTPKASAIRLVFFSIRMHVEPHPDNREAYSARNAAVLRKAALLPGLFMLSPIALVCLVCLSRNLVVSGNIENICIPT